MTSGDLAYTVGVEQGQVRVDGGAPFLMQLRVTHVLRRVNGQWWLVHRHADFPPRRPTRVVIAPNSDHPSPTSEHDMSTQPALPPRRIAFAAFAGTTIEFYDFFIYGTAAALVFGTVFFPALGSAAGTVAALATFAVAFLARPLGSAIFGHLGDRLGRKRTLIFTLTLMGMSTVAVGLLPGAASIGIAAPDHLGPAALRPGSCGRRRVGWRGVARGGVRPGGPPRPVHRVPPARPGRGVRPDQRHLLWSSG